MPAISAPIRPTLPARPLAAAMQAATAPAPRPSVTLPMPKAAPAPVGAGKSPFELVLFKYHQKMRAQGNGSYTLTFTKEEAGKIFGLQPTVANMQAFVQWANTFDRPGNLGPMKYVMTPDATFDRATQNDAAAVRRLQQGLARRGYAVAVNGTYDAATERAVVAFKRAQGLTEAYNGPDGRPVVNPFADERVQAAIARV